MRERIVVRGGGDLATGTIHRLWRAGFQVLVLESEHPSAIRRQVSVSEAVYEGRVSVEGMTAVCIADWKEAELVWREGKVPVLVDPRGSCLAELQPDVLVDAILAKRNLGTGRFMAPLTIGLGPGFTAGKDVDAVIETARGHDLGRVITSGSARPNTGIPGVICGYGRERVIHAPASGVIRNMHRIGEIVKADAILAQIETENGTVNVPAPFSGVLRGLIREGFPVSRGLKIADVDPRVEEQENCWTISDKSRCIAGSVLELICAAGHKKDACGA